MRILAIRGHNLASLEGSFALELASGPLAAAGLFAIAGPTGAGKSTLLDALCLALFDRMPRMPDGSHAAVGSAEEDEKSRIKANDVRSILRRGCGVGWAEVDFETAGGERWRARWELKRARGRADGRLQNQTLSLQNLADQSYLGHTKSEVLEQIQRRLGLDFDQFRRSVLLAQGDFSAFLKADPKERARLLERITGAEVYSRLSQAAFERAKQERLTLESLQAQAGDYAPLAEAERAALEQLGQTRRAALQRLQTHQQNLQQQRAWHQRLQELLTHQSLAEHALNSARQAWEAAAPRRQRWQAAQQAQALRPLWQQRQNAWQQHQTALQRLRQAETAESHARAESAQADSAAAQAGQAHQRAAAELDQAGPALRQARDLDSRLSESARQSSATRARLDQAEAGRFQTRQQLDALHQQQRELQAQAATARAWLESQAELSPLAEQWERWDSGFNDYRAALERAAAAHRHAAALQAQRAELETAVAETAAAGEVAAVAAQRGQQAQAEAERAAAEFDESGLAAAREHLEQARELVQHGLELARNRQTLATQGAQAETEAARHSAAADQAETAAAIQAQLAQPLRPALAEARAAAERIGLSQQQAVQRLRAGLSEGAPCPVCGSCQHPWPSDADAPGVELLHAQQARVAELQRELDQAETTRVEQQTQASAARRQARQFQTEAARLRQALAELDRQDQAQAETLRGLDPAAWLQRQHGLHQELDRLRQRERAAQAARAQLRQAASSAEADRQTLHQWQQRHAELSRRLHALAPPVAEAEAELGQARRQAEAARRQLAPAGAAAVANWGERLDADPAALHRECGLLVQRWRQQYQSRQQAETGLAELAPSQSAHAATLAERERESQQLAAQLAAQREEQAQLSRQRQAYFEGRAAEAVEHALQQALRQAQQQAETAQAGAQRAAQGLAAAQRDHHHAVQGLSAAEVERDRAQQVLDAELQARGLSAAALEDYLSLPPAQLAAEGTALEALEHAVRDAEVRWQERQAQTQSHQAHDPPPLDPAQTEAAWEQARLAAEQTQQDWAEVEAQLRQDQARREQHQRLHAALAAQQAVWETWEGLNELVGSSNGDKFRRFAQSLSLDSLVAQANQHLRQLARRYRLQRVPGSDLDLQVIDSEMGDEIRSIHSLSGGESFLVALALALGLASLSSRHSPVRSLFIDEGFGSLDPATLDTALAALDALQAGGRQIGVISHVPALVERVGAQVRVEREGGGRSRVRLA